MADDGEESWLYESGAAIEQIHPNQGEFLQEKNNEGPEGIVQGYLEGPVEDIPAPPGISGDDFDIVPKDNVDEGDGQLDASVVESEVGHVTNGKEEKEEGERDEDDDEDDDDDDDDDDNINIVIGDIRTAPSSYSALNIKRGGLVSTVRGADKPKQTGKFSVEEFEQIGTINSAPAHEYNLDSLEEKPWRKPGADITDYFNYGFDEDTWRAYCERQKRMRLQESGVGLAALSSNPPAPVPSVAPPTNNFTAVPDVPPPTVRPYAEPKYTPPVSVIPVMTADRREYSRKLIADMSGPPPAIPPGVPPPYGVPPPPTGYPPPPPPGDYPPRDYFQPPEVDPYYHHNSYEPTQDSQWGPGGWAPPPNVKNIPPPGTGPLKSEENHPPGSNPVKKEPSDSASSSRDRDRDRYREKSVRRRSRSRSHERRSRKKRSKSRSPSHRSHKKKKSKKSERSRDKSRERSRDRSRDRSREKESS